MDLAAIQRTAVKAAFQGAAELKTYFGKLPGVAKKGRTDLVTQADLASEAKIIETIHTQYPGHAILAEESGITHGTESMRWVIDPLDGTTNYAHGLPIFGISIAVELAGDSIVGVVMNPLGEELYTAIRGQGAYLNDRPIKVSMSSPVSESLLITGFPYKWGDRQDAIMGRFARCATAARGVRRLGAAALDLCYLASGRADAYWEDQLKPWDTAAGVLIAREAGATVTNLSGTDYVNGTDDLLASNGHIHAEMIALLQTTKDAT